MHLLPLPLCRIEGWLLVGVVCCCKGSQLVGLILLRQFFALSASADQEFDPKKQRQPDVDESIASDEVANVTADFAALSIDKEFGRNCMGIVDTDRLSLAKV